MLNERDSSQNVQHVKQTGNQVNLPERSLPSFLLFSQFYKTNEKKGKRKEGRTQLITMNSRKVSWPDALVLSNERNEGLR